jgi:hypothetical protein
MSNFLKYSLLGLLLIGGVVGCDPYHRYGYYGRDRYGSSYEGPGWGRSGYGRSWGSSDEHREYQGRHHHDD